MIRRPPRSTRTDTLFPYTTLFRSLLERCGVGSRLVSFDANAFSTYAGLDLRGARVICLSYMNAGSLAHARYLVRRLRRRTDARILIGFWSLDPEEAAGLEIGRAHV